MRVSIIVLGAVLSVWAKSAHERLNKPGNNKLPKFTVEGQSLIIKELDQNSSIHSNQLFGRQGTDPTPKEQEARRPPVFPAANCFWCPPKAVLEGDGWTLLSKFTTDEFASHMRSRDTDLVNTCMFYTRAIVSKDTPLSRRATQLACKYKKYSIWHLWPNRINEQNNDKLLNYYGIFDPTNRLYKISQLGDDDQGVPGRIRYFENMSRAMALHCTGDVYILSDTPFDLKRYLRKPDAPNIFGTTEWPALNSHSQTVNRFIVVDNQDTTNAQPRAWEVNLRALETNQDRPVTNWKRGENDTEVLPPGYKPYDLSQELNGLSSRELQERDELCANDGVDDEPAGQDFFG